MVHKHRYSHPIMPLPVYVFLSNIYSLFEWELAMVA